MWIFIGVFLAFVVWVVLKLSVVSLYVLFFVGIVLGTVPYLIRGNVRNKNRE